MSTITLPNIRVGSDLQVRVRLKDGGVAIDWSTLSNIKACIYSDAQRALAGRCAFSIDEEDNTLLVCTYAANKPQYLCVNRIVISAKYMGETKTYDKPAFSFVRWTADQEGEEITIDDPDVDVEIDVEDISSSILQEAVDAAFTAADRANDAAAAAEHMVDIHTGPEGKSAYEVAVEEGYTGTEEEWLASLVGPQGAQGIQGETGEAAGFGSVSAALHEDGGDPSVVVAASGEDTSKNFAFTFNNLKGDKGDKGDQGNTGSSVDYPYELVNNLTTDDATKGLTAAMGVQLEGEVSQLEAKVDESVTQELVEEEGFYLVDPNYNIGLQFKGGVLTVPTKYKGKRFSFLGDSITTFGVPDQNNATGTWTYPGNRCRYPQNNLFTDVNYCWWKRLIDKLGASLGINESWAGSRVSNTQATDSGDLGPNRCISSLTRIGHLDANGTPDVIIVYAGTNDIGNEVTVGSFDTTSPKDLTEQQIAALGVTTFADAFRAMLIRLQYYYRTSRIIVCLPNFTNTYYTMSELDNYIEVIREACDYFGVEYIDLRASGITIYNRNDYLPDGIHPNADGMELLFNKVYNYLMSN